MRADIPVLIVGAGLAGLVTGYELMRRGIGCLILEQSPRVGGRVHTTTFPDGMSAEAHMEEFWQFNPAYQLLQDLHLPLDEDIAHSSLILDGRLRVCRSDGSRDRYLRDMFTTTQRSDFIRWNELAATLLTDLEPGGKLSSPGASAASGLLTVSFADFVRSTTQTPQVAEWIRIVVESETAIEWHEIGALDGVAEMRPFLDTPSGFGQRNAHVEGGNERFTETLARALPEGTIRAEATVTRISDLGHHATVLCTDPREGTTTLTCDQLVVTVPAWNLSRIEMDVELSEAARHALVTSAAGSYVKVLFRLLPEVEDLWRVHGPRLFTLLSDSAAGCIYLSCDEGGERDLVLTTLIHGHFARQLRGLSHKEIARRVQTDLESIQVATELGESGLRPFKGISRYVTDVRAYDYPNAVAYWPVSIGRSRFDAASAALRTPQGKIHFGGDTTECSHSDGAVRSAQRIAHVVAQRLGVRAEATA